MYELPPVEQLEFFVGRVLQQVCVGENEVILHFDADVSLTIEGAVSVGPLREKISSTDRPRIVAPKLLRLLGRAVSAVDVQDRSTLVLEFAGEDKVLISDSNGPSYESYQIRHGNVLHVV